MSKAIATLMTGIALFVTLTGCGGGLSMPPAISPQSYQPLRAQTENPLLIDLPAQAGFAIHTKNSEQAPGQVGKVASTADAQPDGTAFCTAAAAGGGSASSAFVLGAALHNDSDAPLPVAVTCDIEYEYLVKTTAAAGRGTTGNLAFALEAREQTTGKLLFQHPLAGLSGFEEDLKRSDQQRLQFAATIAPTARWQIVLQGRADARAAETGQADVQLRITRCRMTVKQRPASATQPQ